MSKKKLAWLVFGATVLQLGVIRACNDAISIITEPVTFLGALDQLGIINIGA